MRIVMLIAKALCITLSLDYQYILSVSNNGVYPYQMFRNVLFIR
jgi:hypothetical protein